MVSYSLRAVGLIGALRLCLSMLQELLDIKLEAPSIIAGLKILVSKHIEKEYIDPVNTKLEELKKET